MNRRDLLSSAGALFAATPSASAPRLLDPRSFGADATGRTLASPAINAAVDACHAAGGGLVYLSPGTYLSGTVVLKSNVTLYLEAGATLLGSRDIADYTPQSGPNPKGDANQCHLVFARDAENVTLAGPGRIDGQGSAFWAPSGRVTPPAEEAWRDVATYDWKPLPRPSPLLEFVSCRYLRVEDVRIENASGWTLRPINCDHVWIRGISILNPVIGPNTDGIDPTDDAICLKSENPYGGAPLPNSNITITNCVLTCCCNGLKFGTATRGVFENITFSNSVIYNADVDPRARVISGIALEMVDGGSLEGVVITGIRMQRVRTPIFIRRGNRRPRPDGTPGTLRGIRIENLHASGSILTSSITGLPGFPAEDVTLAGIEIESLEAGSAAWVSRAIPEVPAAYPEARMFGRLPAYGLYCRHARGLRLRDVAFTAASGEARPVLLCDDVDGLEVESLRCSAITGTEPTVKLQDTRNAWLHGSQAPAGSGAYLAVDGASSAAIALTHCHLTAAARPLHLAPGLPPTTVEIRSA
jgi:hypothetical protein